MFSAVAIATLISVCTPWAEPRLLMALVMAGSDGESNLVADASNGRYVGTTISATRRHIERYSGTDEQFIGLTQVPRSRLASQGVTVEQALDPCANLQIGYQLLLGAHDTASRIEKAPWKTVASAFAIYRDQRPSLDSTFAAKAMQYLMSGSVITPAGMNSPLRHQMLAIWSASQARAHGARDTYPKPSPLAESAAISAWARRQI